VRAIGQLTVPLLVLLAVLAAFLRGVDVYDAMTAGARKGLVTLWEILPSLLVIFPAIRLFRASGLPELLGTALRPVFTLLGVPEETGLLMLLRPLSGSGALAVASELMQRHGPDSLIGRTAAVMLGSSETSLYVLAVYFSAAGVRDDGRALPAALCADLVCFLASAWICKILWG
jgi:spore maturation protein B